MLDAAGAKSLDDLFRSIPQPLRLTRPLDVPPALDEISLFAEFRRLAERNEVAHPPFAGAGCYPHHVPPVVDQLLLRGEFFTAYTPYQPEISQGTLQALFEWQTFVCLLTGMDVSNASMYDGATVDGRGGAHGDAAHRPEEDRRLRGAAPGVPQGARDVPALHARRDRGRPLRPGRPDGPRRARQGGGRRDRLRDRRLAELPRRRRAAPRDRGAREEGGRAVRRRHRGGGGPRARSRRPARSARTSPSGRSRASATP